MIVSCSPRFRGAAASFVGAAVIVAFACQPVAAQCSASPTVVAWITPSTCVVRPTLHLSYTAPTWATFDGIPQYHINLDIQLVIDGTVRYDRLVTRESESGTIDIPQGEPSGGDGSPYWLANPGDTLRIVPIATCSPTERLRGTAAVVTVPEDGCIITPPPPPPPDLPPRFTFQLTAAANTDPLQARLLTHAYHQATDAAGVALASAQSFSSYQLDAGHTIPRNAGRVQMRIDGAVVNPPAANEIWFKLIDPLDDAGTASYVPDADRQLGDNHDSGSARLMTADGQRIAGIATPLQTTWDGGHGVNLILQGSDHAAGDNYEIIASFSPPDANGRFPCESAVPAGCDHSPIVTVWKRIYVESHRMFRAGAFLGAPVVAGDQSIIVRDDGSGNPPNFSAGQVLRLVGGAPAALHRDDVIVAARLDAAGNPLPPVTSAGNSLWRVYVTGSIGGSYTGTPAAGVQPTTALYSDAVGVSGDYYEADTQMLKPFFASMYVDVAEAPPSVAEFSSIPDLPDPNEGTPSPYAAFPRSAEPIVANRFIESRDQNVFHLFGAGGFETVVTQTGNSAACTTHFGDTQPRSTGNYSYIYVGQIERAVLGPTGQCPFQFQSLSGRNAAAMNQATVAHEITHQFYVNHDAAFTAGKSGGHCSEPAQVPPGIGGDLCLMNGNFPTGVVNASQLDLPRLAFHWSSRGADSEYTQVRTRPEPATAP